MSDTSTRSGLLWEVERILDECKELPQILLMENVPQVIGTGNVEHFNKWQLKLEELGYKNYHQNLIATDYGIPQTRNRTFMVSILGDYGYTFPNPIPLKLKLKDMLEDNVDERYYLSDKLIKCFNDNGTGKYPRGDRFRENIKNGTKEIANTIITTEGNKPTCNFVLTKDTENYIEWKEKGKLDIDKIQEIWRPIENKISNGLRIRKLSPLEVFRLMGVKDEDYERIAQNQSDSSLYHLAGDSIVVNVLMAIFKELIK